MSDFDIEQAAEVAAQRFLRGQNISWVQPPADNPGGADHIYRGLEGPETQDESGESRVMVLPCIIASCQQAEPILPNFHGNWNLSLRIEIRSQCDEATGDQHADRVREIGRLFYTNNISGDLSRAIPDFFVKRAVPGTRGWGRDDRAWVSFMEFTLISCCLVTIADQAQPG